jgi:hypothetical protein
VQLTRWNSSTIRKRRAMSLTQSSTRNKHYF